ncbi:MAG: polysaccharide deacetylase family protein [Acidimicrobiales bacterium]
MALLAAAMLAGACSGGGTSKAVAPSTSVPVVLPSADRIHLAQTRLGGPASCLDDAYCAAGLTRVYGIDLGDRSLALADPAATVGALNAGAIDIGVLPRSALDARSLHPGEPAPPVVTLADDLRLQPARNLVAVTSTPLGHVLGPLLQGISAKFDQASLDALEQGLSNGVSPDQLAAAWLQGHGYTGPAPAPSAGAPSVAIAVPADAEGAAVADVYAGALDASGVPIGRAPLDGGLADMLDAMASGRANLAIAPVSSLLEHLSGYAGVSSADLARSLTRLRSRLADLGLAATRPTPGSPGVVFTVSIAVARALGLSNHADLARASGAHPPPPSTTTTTLTTTTLTSTTTTAAVPATPTLGPSLGIGAGGPPVAALQHRLMALGYSHLFDTATFDEATRRTVTAFQSDQGLIPTGEDDAATQRALAAAHPTAHPATPPVPGDGGSLRPPASAIYLAFAGGPSAATTQILQALNRRSAGATFFAGDGPIGRHRDIVRAVSAANGIGTSAAPHDATSAIAADALMRTASRTREDLASAVGKTSNCMLAPYGATDATTLRRAADQGLRTVLWDVDPQDWRRPGADAIAADVIDNVRAGSIVLLHDGGGDRSQTVTAVATILDTLEARGYTFSPIPDCVL